MGPDGVSIQQPHDCLLNRLFRRKSKKTSQLRVTGFCAGNSPVTGEFPAQMGSNAENVSIWWRHHVFTYTVQCRHYAAHFLQNVLNRHTKARPWIQTLIYLMPDSMQCCRNTLLIASRCTNGTDCTCLNISAGLSYEARGDGRVVGYDARHISGGRSYQHMKQFAHSWYLPGCLCTGHVLMPPSF